MDIKRILDSYRQVEYKARSLAGEKLSKPLCIKKHSIKRAESSAKENIPLNIKPSNIVIISKRRPSEIKSSVAPDYYQILAKKQEEIKQQGRLLRYELFLNTLIDTVEFKRKNRIYEGFKLINTLKRIKQVKENDISAFVTKLTNLFTNTSIRKAFNNIKRAPEKVILKSSIPKPEVEYESLRTKIASHTSIDYNFKELKEPISTNKPSVVRPSLNKKQIMDYITVKAIRDYGEGFFRFKRVMQVFGALKSNRADKKPRDVSDIDFIEEEIRKFNEKIDSQPVLSENKASTTKPKLNSLNNMQQRQQERKLRINELKLKQTEKLKQKKLEEQKKADEQKLKEEEELKEMRLRALKEKEDMKKTAIMKKERTKAIKEFRLKQLKRSVFTVLSKNIELRKTVVDYLKNRSLVCVKRRLLKSWKTAFKHINRENLLKHHKAVFFCNQQSKKNVLSILKINLTRARHEHNELIQKFKAAQRVIYFNKWISNLKYFKAENYETMKRDNEIVHKFRFEFLGRKLLETLKNNKEEADKEKLKNKIKQKLKGDVHNWLNDFRAKKLQSS